MNKDNSKIDTNILLNSGMKFFGKMSASATHEIKNTLAIINENAGLLEDLLVLADRGNELSHEKLNTISHRIKRQVLRADDTLKKLNRFSHSVDSELEIIDLNETLSFVVDFGSRLTERAGLSITVVKTSSPVFINANLFYVQHLIWRAIETICYDLESKEQLNISVEITSNNKYIWFSAQKLNGSTIENILESDQDKKLMDHLGVSINKDKDKKSFGLLWSK